MCTGNKICAEWEKETWLSLKNGFGELLGTRRKHSVVVDAAKCMHTTAIQVRMLKRKSIAEMPLRFLTPTPFRCWCVIGEGGYIRENVRVEVACMHASLPVCAMCICV